MNRSPTDPLNELPDGLREVVAGIVERPVPNELMQPIAMQILSRRKLRRHNRSRQRLTSIVVLSAAIAMVSVLFLPKSTTISDSHKADTVQLESTSAPTTKGPSLWTYHQAAGESYDDLDQLLDQHAVSIFSDRGSAPDLRNTSPIIFNEEEL